MASLREHIVSGTWREKSTEFRNDRLIISARSGTDVEVVLNSAAESIAEHVQGAPEVVRPPDRPWAVLEFRPPANAGEHIPALAAKLAGRPGILYAEPDFICTGHVAPNDPFYRQQWWAETIGIEEAWKFTHGAPHVLLAIVDSGISIPAGGALPDHEDLNGPRFIVSHKRNGVTIKQDYVEHDVVPRDVHGHGTHVAGIAAAAGNNAKGVAGVNWNSCVYVARVLGAENQGSASSVKRAVQDILSYAAAPTSNETSFLARPKRRVVINLSLGFTDHAESLGQMCAEAGNGEVILCVAAASRDATPTNIDYPAAFADSFDHVIAVGATDRRDHIVLPVLGSYEAITILAPGQDIESTTPTYGVTGFQWTPSHYHKAGGTSQACAIVAGVVSLVWSAKYTLTPAQIKLGLLQSAKKIQHNGKWYPRIDVGQAVTLAGQNPPGWP